MKQNTKLTLAQATVTVDIEDATELLESAKAFVAAIQSYLAIKYDE